MAPLVVVGIIFICLIIPFLLRVAYLLYKIFTSEIGLVNIKPLRTVMCMGSGGHTTELLRLTKSININKYHPRLYILADNDSTSEVMIKDTEDELKTHYSLRRIPRSRNVHQSYRSSVISTIYATLYTVPVLYNFKPDIIFCNGPGTCIPVCVVAFLMRCLFILDCRIIFIESICRVHSLSLTGKILEFFADLVIVQWPELKDVCFRAKYFGRLT